MIDFTPNPIAFQLGPIPVYWYGLGYALGLAAAAWLMTREARRRGEDAELIPNGLIVVALAALIGGRLYHVIDQWRLYQDDLFKIILPPYTGLGAFGGLLTGVLAMYVYTRIKRVSFWTWADIVAPGVFVMQGIARWGNFFNQELYGSPTTLPWGIAIECVHRIPAYTCDKVAETAHFHPLFLYESISGLLGAATLLWLARRYGSRLRPGDLAMVFFIWYSAVRFVLEFLRADNWTFFGIATAQVVSLLVILTAVSVLIIRHRPGALDSAPSSDGSAHAGLGGQAGEGSIDDAVSFTEPPPA